jgi:hypothetical protein
MARRVASRALGDPRYLGRGWWSFRLVPGFGLRPIRPSMTSSLEGIGQFAPRVMDVSALPDAGKNATVHNKFVR